MSNIDSYNNLPSEIWFKIIQQLLQKDLFECQKVCKSWYLSTRQYFWKNVELKTVDHIESFLNYFPKYAKKYVKSIVIGDLSNCDICINNTLSIEQSKELLLNLPNLEKIYITDSFSKSLITELNNEEFLIEFCEKCPNIESFKSFEAPLFHTEDYSNIMYSLRNTAKSIIVNNTNHDIYQQLSSFSQLEHLTMDKDEWSLKTFLEFLYKIETLSQLKYIYFSMNLNIPVDEEMGMRNVLRTIEEDQILKERLASLEKLHLCFDDITTYSNDTSIITQYFVGLKEIDVHYLDDTYPTHSFSQSNVISNEWADYIFSHDEYRLEIDRKDIEYYVDLIKMCLIKHFKQKITDKRMKQHIWLGLDCMDYDKLDPFDWDSHFEFGTFFSLEFEAKEIDDNQLSKIATMNLMNAKDTLHNIYEIFNSTNNVIENIDTLTLDFYSEDKNYFSCNIFQYVDQILSLTTDTLEKVIIRTDNFCKWSKYFAKYEKVKTYCQVTHLEIYVNSNTGELLDDFTLSQLIMIFPCIKYLKLENFYDITPNNIPENSDIFINLPQIDLKKLTLDATPLKLRAQEVAKSQNDFLDTYFILRVDTNKKSYQYQVSLDFLNVTELVKDDEELGLKKSLQIHIILKNIESLGLYYIYNLFILGETKRYGVDCYGTDIDTIREKICERRIYFE